MDLRALLRAAVGRAPEPFAAVIDSRMLRSSPESGHRAGCGRAKRKRGSRVHAAVDTLGHFPVLHVTPATADDRAEVGRLAQAVQEAMGESVQVAYGDQGHTGERAQSAAAEQGIRLEVVRLAQAKRGFVLLPQTVQGLYVVAFACLMLARQPWSTSLTASSQHK